LPQAALNVENKSRSNPLPWRGQFTPQLVQLLLDRYADRGSVVLDPFLGSGTLLSEAGRAGLAAFGSEINPAAVILARVYTLINVPAESRRVHLQQVNRSLQRAFPVHALRDPQAPGMEARVVKRRLTDVTVSSKSAPEGKLLEALVVLMDFYREVPSVQRVFASWRKIEALVTSLPFSERPLQVFHTDARRIPLADSCVDLVVTSPPYINVFNYHQKYRASTEALNWDLLAVARSEFGANRKYRGNRFLTVVQFCLDLAQTFDELRRVCRNQGHLIFVVGRESRVRGTPLLNGEIVAEVGHRAAGFRLFLRQERVFTNRFGTRIFEDILHFSPPTQTLVVSSLEEARVVAREVLSTCYPFAPDESKEDVQLALDGLERVKPSPIFEARKAQGVSSRRRHVGG